MEDLMLVDVSSDGGDEKASTDVKPHGVSSSYL